MKEIQLMVGPTTIPERVLHAMNRQIISHRSPEFCKIQESVSMNLKKLFQTKNDVYTLTCSGTGAMETAIQNCFSPGDKVVGVVTGNFGERISTIAETFGLNVTRVKFELGETADVNKIMEYVDSDTKGVLVIQNESSTGVFNDLKVLGDALKDTNALLVADSVSGMGGIEVKMDEWNVDVLFTSSQKALMTPPGISFISLSEKAWNAVENSKNPKFYFDLKKAREYSSINQTPWTCPVLTIYGVEEALNMIFEEGLDNVLNRHKKNANLVREGVKKLGFSLFAKDENYASPTLTAVRAPGKSKMIVKALAEEGVIIGGGLKPLSEDIFRVGTMGYVSENDIAAFLYALEKVVRKLNL